MSRIAISKLAEYASDPSGYCQRQGGVINKKAADYGTKAHEQLGRKTTSSWIYMIIAVIIAIIASLIWYSL